MRSSLIFLLSKVMGNNGEWIQILKLVITQLSYQITSKLMVKILEITCEEIPFT